MLPCLDLTSEVYIHPNYNSQNFTNDVAVLVLSEDVEPISISLQRPKVGNEVILLVSVARALRRTAVMDRLVRS